MTFDDIYNDIELYDEPKVKKNKIPDIKVCSENFE